MTTEVAETIRIRGYPDGGRRATWVPVVSALPADAAAQATVVSALAAVACILPADAVPGGGCEC